MKSSSSEGGGGGLANVAGGGGTVSGPRQLLGLPHQCERGVKPFLEFSVAAVVAEPPSVRLASGSPVLFALVQRREHLVALRR
jgi:hypothetical protein